MIIKNKITINIPKNRLNKNILNNTIFSLNSFTIGTRLSFHSSAVLCGKKLDFIKNMLCLSNKNNSATDNDIPLTEIRSSRKRRRQLDQDNEVELVRGPQRGVYNLTINPPKEENPRHKLENFDLVEHRAIQEVADADRRNIYGDERSLLNIFMFDVYRERLLKGRDEEIFNSVTGTVPLPPKAPLNRTVRFADEVTDSNNSNAVAGPSNLASNSTLPLQAPLGGGPSNAVAGPSNSNLTEGGGSPVESSDSSGLAATVAAEALAGVGAAQQAVVEQIITNDGVSTALSNIGSYF
uniref:Uncharacterized protein n=1 Tax=Pyrrhoderma lamaoense TaxID=2282106 RepID=A0A5B9RCV6_9AGAM|nr:hypothetical protein PLAO_000052 [Phellinus lamaoensis]QEG57149.1 hypothetical protein PLAO_000052 [Phellinus lamaoensis]